MLPLRVTVRPGISALLALSFALLTSRTSARADEAPPLPPEVASLASVPGSSPLTPRPAVEGAPLERLDLGNGEIAYVALPVGAEDRRAIVVGVHGAGDHADWACSEWQATLASWAFVVCPQGVKHATWEGTFVWGSATAIAAQADRAVAAVRARYGAFISDGPLIYAGWSQGATLAAQVIASRPGTYDRVALVEIGHTPLDASSVASTLVASGVRRAVVTCESWKCRAFAQGFQSAARTRGLQAQLVDVGLRNHWFDEPVFRALAPKMVWMVEDQQRFVGLGAAVDARWMTD